MSTKPAPKKKKRAFATRKILVRIASPGEIKKTTVASIGRTITRHSILDYLLLTTMCGVMEMSIKHGRLVLRVPPGRRFVTLMRDLFAVHKIKVRFNTRQLGERIEAANDARNVLAHSLLLWNQERNRVEFQVVKGTWDLPQEYEALNRAIDPQAKAPDAAFLRAKRKAVEDGIRIARRYVKVCKKAMHTLNEKRRTQSALDRRRHDQTPKTP